MGATHTINEAFGYTHDEKGMKEAYNAVVNECKIQYGDNPYNGTISTTEGVMHALVNGVKAEPISVDSFKDSVFYKGHPQDFGAEKRENSAAVPVFEEKDNGEIDTGWVFLSIAAE